MQKLNETTKSTLDVLAYVQQLTNDVDRLYGEECDGSKEDIVCDE